MSYWFLNSLCKYFIFLGDQLDKLAGSFTGSPLEVWDARTFLFDCTSSLSRTHFLTSGIVGSTGCWYRSDKIGTVSVPGHLIVTDVRIYKLVLPSLLIEWHCSLNCAVKYSSSILLKEYILLLNSNSMSALLLGIYGPASRCWIDIDPINTVLDRYRSDIDPLDFVTRVNINTYVRFKGLYYLTDSYIVIT